MKFIILLILLSAPQLLSLSLNKPADLLAIDPPLSHTPWFLPSASAPQPISPWAPSLPTDPKTEAPSPKQSVPERSASSPAAAPESSAASEVVVDIKVNGKSVGSEDAEVVINSEPAAGNIVAKENAGPDPAPVVTTSQCSDAGDCLGCFVKKECKVVTGDGNESQTCSPCVWCSNQADDWDADVIGSCVPAHPEDRANFCNAPLDEEEPKKYCPPSMCKPGETDCICDEDVCPVVNVLMRLVSLEGFWLLATLVILGFVGVVSCCTLVAFGQPPPRQIVLVRERHAEDDSPELRPATEREYRRLQEQK